MRRCSSSWRTTSIPRAMSKKVRGFVQARNWSQDLTPISLA